MSDGNEPIRILFVCMGNICRSPLAECVFVHKARERGVHDRFEIDSAGTGGWHVGERPDGRMRAVAERNGVTLDGRARQVKRRDFERFDLLVCMDENNRHDLLDLGAPESKIRPLLTFDAAKQFGEVPDPYYGGADGFNLVYRLVDAACEGLLDHLLAQRDVETSKPEIP
jgi:protein-tyrosine phosphatase